MSEPKALTDRSVAERWQEVKTTEQWWDDAYDAMRDLFQKYIEDSLEYELVEQLQEAQYNRDPDHGAGSRNGYRYRSLQTRLGVIRDLRVPRRRAGPSPSVILPPYSRREPETDGVVSGAFVAGVSTRRVGPVLQPLTGEAISATTVSRISKSLDAQVRRFHQRALPDDVRYLFLDGIRLKIKGIAAIQNKVILAAYALRATGLRELLDFQVATAESEAQWEAFLNSLYRRGLEGTALRQITTDGGTGLHEALQVVYGFVARQRCWVHKLRNVMSKLPVRLRDECLGDLRIVYMAESVDNARQRYRAWAEKWRTRVPKAVECVEKDIDELLTFLREPVLLASRLRTTNAIERAFREVRRRTNPMSSFNSDASCERIIYAVFQHQNETWRDRSIADWPQERQP